MKEITLEAASRHALEDYPREACGLIVIPSGTESERYVRCKNIAEHPDDHFILDPEDYANAEDMGKITAVVHSHPDAAARPSQGDLVSCEMSNLEWHILSVFADEGAPRIAQITSFQPSGYVAPLIGRQFCHGILDCYSIIRDWYKQERNIDLPNFTRTNEWWHKGENLYLDLYSDAGFKPITYGAPLEVGDVIIMQLRAPVANHAGVYIGNGLMLHHMQHRLSTTEVYGGYWAQITRLIVRYAQ